MLRHDRKGSALLTTVLVSAVALGVLTYAVSALMPSLNFQKNRSAGLLKHRLALNSIVDYTLYAVRERWCLSDGWLRDVDCPLSHPRNTERLLLSDSTSKEIADNATAFGLAPGASVRLPKIEQTLNLAEMSPTHPLYVALRDVRLELEEVKVSITRISNVNQPTSGRETFVSVRVDAKKKATAFSDKFGNRQVWSEATVGFYPREINSFALLLKGDLVLNSDLPSAHRPNSAWLPNFVNRADAGAGLVFQSPIFVNHSVYLPDTSHETDPAKIPYNNVTFGDSVVLGAGLVYKDGDVYRPASYGASADRYNTQVSDFGGFMRGTDMDGEIDKGLENLFGGSSVSADASLMKKCIERNQKRANMSRTKNSVGVLKKMGTGYNGEIRTYQYRLGLTDTNEFREAGALSSKIVTDSATISSKYFKNATHVANGEVLPPIMRVKVGIDGSEAFAVESLMARNSDVTVEMKRCYNTTSLVSPSPTPSASPVPVQTAHGSPSCPATAETDHLPSIRVKAEPFHADQINLTIEVSNEKYLQGAPRIDIEFFDLATTKQGFSARPASTGPNRFDNLLTYSISGDPSADTVTLSEPARFSATGNWVTFPTGVSPDSYPADSEDPEDLATACTQPSGSNGAVPAFGYADWGIDFSATATTSWNFKPPSGSDLIFPDNAPSSDFHIYSIVPNRCIVKSSATLVAGFLTCPSFEIEARSAPLRIIGTIIAGNLKIDPSAIRAGIVWSNIYHPEAVNILKSVGILKSDTACSAIPVEPIWHPQPSLKLWSDTFKCTPASLRGRTDPFTWSTVDPVCGLVSGSPATTCKIRYRSLRFKVVEFSRRTSL